MNRPLFLTALILVVSAFSQTAEWPTRASRSFSSNFGENRDDHFHMGLDIKTRGTTGHKIVASHDGYISRMVSNYSGYGKALYIKTTSGNEIVYGHMEKFTPVLEKVWRLQQAKRRSYVVNANFSSREFPVTKGDLIGYSGNTGSSFAPHIHYEYRTPGSEPLNPLAFAFDLPDNVTPTPRNIALVPLSQETLINASPLVQTFPLYRDRSGVYYFADTVSVFGEFAFAIEAVDKRQGANNVYQFHWVELIFDGKIEFELRYD
ncbi:MAG: M23 family metallopeptidase, partial [Candidatus Marinimicrobia bacterium]|nr:M23 family metallopeptidase [Candidatus Neomarinimicrobiota bacterium]